MVDGAGRDRALQAGGLVIEPAAMDLADAVATLEQGLGRGPAHGHEDRRGYQLDMPDDEGQAGGDLVGRRVAIARRPPEDDVRDVEAAGPREPYPGEHPIQQLTADADEGLAHAIFVRAGRLADEHDPSGR